MNLKLWIGYLSNKLYCNSQVPIWKEYLETPLFTVYKLGNGSKDKRTNDIPKLKLFKGPFSLLGYALHHLKKTNKITIHSK